MYNNKFLLLIFFLLGAIPAFSQSTLRIVCYYNSFWGDWKDYSICCQGGYSGFVLYEKDKHPSEYHFAFLIDGYTPPSKKEIKEHYKNDIWWTYTGAIEYYISDVYPTFKSILMEFGRPMVKSDTYGSYYWDREKIARAENMRKNGKVIGFTRVQSKATIKIAPYKEHPNTYNIWVEDVGFAISLNGQHF